jgi:hypothetical protein
MPPSVAVSFVEQAPCDGLSERETVLLSKFEHAAYCFLPLRLAGCGWRCLDGRFLSERKEVRFQRHATGVSARKESRFNLGPQVKGDGHRNLSSEFTPARSLSNSNLPVFPLGVNNVSLTIPPGVTSLVGPNGSGKTTASRWRGTAEPVLCPKLLRTRDSGCGRAVSARNSLRTSRAALIG